MLDWLLVLGKQLLDLDWLNWDGPMAESPMDRLASLDHGNMIE